MQSGIRRECLEWLILAIASIGPLFFFPGYHGIQDSIAVFPYWLWQACLLIAGFWLMQRRTEKPHWLTAVATIVLICNCLVAAEYFMDWAAWYK